jgi:hypothetical protein
MASENGAEPTAETPDGGPSEYDRKVSVSEQITQDRIAAISDARAECRTAREQSELMYRKGKIAREARDIIYREAVESYLLELKPYCEAVEDTNGYWFSEDEPHLGAVWATPPPEDSEAWETRADAPAHLDLDDLEPRRLAVVKNLTEFLLLPRTFETAFAKTQAYPHGSDAAAVAHVTETIDRETITAAMDWGNQFAHRIGLDLSMGGNDIHADPL